MNMNVFNSRAGQPEDDADITIINPSITESNEDSLTNSQVQRPTTTVPVATNDYFPSTTDPSDYIFVHHDPLENVKKIEDALLNYVRDLKQESNSQLDCDKQLVIRLIDLIRPAYSTNQQKLDEFDRIRDDIGVLHDKRFVQQKEKIEELRSENARLNRMLFTASNDHSIYDDQMRSYSVYNSLPTASLVTGYSQWTEIENDAKKLHEIVQSQRNQIDEIVTLISRATSPASSIEQSGSASINQTTDTTAKPAPISSSKTINDKNLLSTILGKLQGISKRPPPIFHNLENNESNATTIISAHSPGSSPSDSMNALIMKTITTSINEPEPVVVTPVEPEPVVVTPVEPEPVVVTPVEPKPVDVRPVNPLTENPVRVEVPILVNPVPVSPLSPDALRRCPVCNYEFPPQYDDVEMYEHIDKCLFPADTFQAPKEYACPRCDQKFPADKENDYLQHMSDCFNNRFDE